MAGVDGDHVASAASPTSIGGLAGWSSWLEWKHTLDRDDVHGYRSSYNPGEYSKLHCIPHCEVPVSSRQWRNQAIAKIIHARLFGRTQDFSALSMRLRLLTPIFQRKFVRNYIAAMGGQMQSRFWSSKAFTPFELTSGSNCLLHKKNEGSSRYFVARQGDSVR